MTVGWLWVIAALNYLDRLMITTIRDPLKADIAMTDAQFGLLTSVFLWVYGLVSPLGGFLADRFSRSKVIAASLFIWSAVTWLTGHMHSFEGLLAARALMGISEACYIPAALALIADYHPGPTRSLATGLHMSGVYAGAALGGLGGYLAEPFGWRAGFNLFGGFGIVYSLFILFAVQDPPRERHESARSRNETAQREGQASAWEALGTLFAQPAFLFLLAVNALVGIANWGIYGWLPTYLKEHFRLGLGAAGMTATGYIQVASFVGGVWADRWSRREPRARALVPAIGYFLVAPALYLAASTSLLGMAIAGSVVFGLGRGFFDANHMPILRYIAGSRYSATGYGFLNFISCLTGGVMIYVGGWLKDAQVDLSRTFQVSAAGLLIVSGLLFSIRRQGVSDA